MLPNRAGTGAYATGGSHAAVTATPPERHRGWGDTACEVVETATRAVPGNDMHAAPVRDSAWWEARQIPVPHCAERAQTTPSARATRGMTNMSEQRMWVLQLSRSRRMLRRKTAGTRHSGAIRPTNSPKVGCPSSNDRRLAYPPALSNGPERRVAG